MYQISNGITGLMLPEGQLFWGMVFYFAWFVAVWGTVSPGEKERISNGVALTSNPEAFPAASWDSKDHLWEPGEVMTNAQLEGNVRTGVLGTERPQCPSWWCKLWGLPFQVLCFCMSGFQCASQAQNCYIDLSTFNKNTFCVNKSRVLAGGRCFGYHTLSSSHVPGRRELMPKGVKHMKTVTHVTVVNPLLGSPRNLCLREDIAKGKRWETIIKII